MVRRKGESACNWWPVLVARSDSLQLRRLSLSRRAGGEFRLNLDE